MEERERESRRERERQPERDSRRDSRRDRQTDRQTDRDRDRENSITKFGNFVFHEVTPSKTFPTTFFSSSIKPCPHPLTDPPSPQTPPPPPLPALHACRQGHGCKIVSRDLHSYLQRINTAANQISSIRCFSE